MSNQSQLRKAIQAQRQSLSKQQQADYSAQICEQIIKRGILDNAQHIAFYLPVRGEADPTPLQFVKQYSDKQFYLPILSDVKENHLAFALYDQNTKMKLNKFRIPEPDVEASSLLHDPKQLDIVIAPLVGIDSNGNRIGMGGGFYDRTFAFKKEKNLSPRLIGFAYDFQFIEPQTPQEWDVAVDSIALQSSYKLCSD